MTPDAIIEVRVAELRQLFNAMDPSPFRERDLDPAAAAFIADWAAELPEAARPSLLVHLDRSAGAADENVILQDAVRQHFAREAASARRRLRLLLRRGRTSLAIGLAFLAAAIGLASLVQNALRGGVAVVASESLLIGGWVAMWRPLEVFLYDWWPIRAETRRYDRLAAMPVRIQYADVGPPDAWRRDWPHAPLPRREDRTA